MALLEIENPNDPVSLRFKMDGPVFKEGIPVHIMVDSLSHVQGILDKAYLGLIDKKRLTREERSKYYLLSQRVVRGSLLSDLGVIYSGIQTVLPLVGVLGPTGIWEYAKETYEFIKFVFESVKNDKQINYTWNAKNSVLHVNNGTQTQTFNGPVYNIANLSINHYQGLNSHLEESKVTELQLGRTECREIAMSLSDRGLFDFPSKIEDAIHKIKGEIFDFNKFENAGKLHVFAGQSIPEGDYRFVLIGKQDVVAYIQAMLRQAVMISCLQEVSHNPISGDKIVCLQVVSVET